LGGKQIANGRKRGTRPVTGHGAKRKKSPKVIEAGESHEANTGGGHERGTWGGFISSGSEKRSVAKKRVKQFGRGEKLSEELKGRNGGRVEKG